MSADLEKAPGELRILSGDMPRDYVGPRATLHFSSLLAESIHDSAPIILSGIRERVRAVLNGPTSVLLGQTFPLDRLYPYPSDLEAITIIYRDIRKMLRDGTLFAALVGEELAGIGGFMEVSRTEQKKPIIELRRTVLDREYRGMNLYQALADARLQQVKERAPDALIINATRQPSVIEWSVQNGFSEIDWHRFYADHKKFSFNKHQMQLFADRVKRFRWRYFEAALKKP